MNDDLPPWLGGATRPGPRDADRLRVRLEPPVLALLRESTRATDAEILAFHRRRPRRAPRARWFLAPVALVAGLALVVRLQGPGTVREAPPIEAAPGLFTVQPGVDAFVAGVWVRGSGTVREIGPGRLEVSGDLELDLQTRTILVVHGRPVALGPGRVRTGPDGITPPPAPERVDPPAPTPAHARPVVDADRSAWMEVLAQLEEGDTADQIRRLEQFTAAYPASRYAAEARATVLLLRDSTTDAESRLREIEGWLQANPDRPRALEIRALAARIARDELRDCARAQPHDEAVARAGAPAARATAAAFLGLCASADGRAAEAAAWFDQIDRALLDPELRQAIADHQRR